MERAGSTTEERKLLVHRCSMGVSTSFCPLVEEANTEKRLTTDSGLFTSIITEWRTTTNYELGEEERLHVGNGKMLPSPAR